MRSGEPVVAIRNSSNHRGGGATGRRSRFTAVSAAILAVSLVTCAVLSILISRSKAPTIDEGWFASPARALFETGTMATYNLDPTGSWLNGDLTGIHEHTYMIMPLHTITLAAVFSIVGFGLQAARSVSIACALIVILAWFYIVKSLCRNEYIAALTAALIALDSTFLWQAAEARCDMMCLALGSAGLATYLILRHKHLATSLLAGNAFVAASTLTHPNGVLMAAELFFLVAWLDRRSLRWIHILTLLPWLTDFGLWGFYILHDPPSFAAQFAANAGARAGARFSGLLSPFHSLAAEMNLYFSHFNPLSPAGPRASTLNLILAIIYLALIPVAALSSLIRRKRSYKTTLILSVIGFSFFTFTGLKLEFYIVFMIPMFATLGAILLRLHSPRSTALCAGIAAIALLLHMNTVFTNISDDSYHKEHLPLIQMLSEGTRSDDLIMGSSALCFDLSLQRIDDDARLGYISRLHPSYIVVDRFYKRFFNIFSREQPEVRRYILRMLNQRSRIIFQNRYYTVYKMAG